MTPAGVKWFLRVENLNAWTCDIVVHVDIEPDLAHFVSNASNEWQGTARLALYAAVAPRYLWQDALLPAVGDDAASPTNVSMSLSVEVAASDPDDPEKLLDVSADHLSLLVSVDTHAH